MYAISDIEKLPIRGKNILIIGNPASGKTYVSGLLPATHHTIIHTDDYIQYGHVDSLSKLLDDMEQIEGNTLIEGVLGYRLLRKGVELGVYFPDIVIELQTSPECVEMTYTQQRQPEKLKNLKGFTAGLGSVLRGYKEMFNPFPPIWIQVKNEYVGFN